ncbi:FxLYD domain-containing protein [Natrarchaeobaculum sulfurireducens]|uniref:Uncharacterized protein n=1 Tax=Natrarchaeobaculum sulfurireducens TaxID=2044521 RepID=A0A346PIW3_9EURY|nr:FxLYD domain-containing protein [Natrarchaeobaculum sulfurireducens]AXR79458.1 hypothetical protein AArc1_3152 [Natrarchaeobaculum sulfurireducens]
MSRTRRSADATAGRDDRWNRRRVLAGVGVGASVALAGCNGVLGQNAPSYEEGTVDVDGEPRSADEMAAAEALADQEIDDGMTPLNSLSLEDHEFVFEDDFRGATVQGTIANDGDDRIQSAEVRTRIYDPDGDQLGRYLDFTGDLESGSTWAFEVVLLESPDEIGGYDVAALGTPS